MKLSLTTATKLLSLIQKESPVPSSSVQGAIVQKMIDDGVVQKIQSGRTKALLFVRDIYALKAYLLNHFGINNLEEYIDKLSSEALMRSEAIAVSGNSKLKAVRTFKGFLVNCYLPVEATLQGKTFDVSPAVGSFTFIYNYETFVPAAGVTIVGVENPENFRFVERQQYLFENILPLFVSRYPQSYDLPKWLQSISNQYLHFGDLDFGGISIYLNEYKKYLTSKASFFIPKDLEQLLDKYGNRELYNKQLHLARRLSSLDEPEVDRLLQLFHKYKKVLEQEIFIK